MDVNYLLDYLGEIDISSKVSSFEKIVTRTIENLANDEVEDDIVALEPVTQKEALKALTTLYNFLHYENSSLELLDTKRKIRDEIQVDLNSRKNIQ